MIVSQFPSNNIRRDVGLGRHFGAVFYKSAINYNHTPPESSGLRRKNRKSVSLGKIGSAFLSLSDRAVSCGPRGGVPVHINKL